MLRSSVRQSAQRTPPWWPGCGDSRGLDGARRDPAREVLVARVERACALSSCASPEGRRGRERRGLASRGASGPSRRIWGSASAQSTRGLTNCRHLVPPLGTRWRQFAEASPSRRIRRGPGLGWGAMAEPALARQLATEPEPQPALRVLDGAPLPPTPPEPRLEIPPYELPAALALERELGVSHVLAQILVRRGWRSRARAGVPRRAGAALAGEVRRNRAWGRLDRPPHPGRQPDHRARRLRRRRRVRDRAPGPRAACARGGGELVHSLARRGRVRAVGHHRAAAGRARDAAADHRRLRDHRDRRGGGGRGDGRRGGGQRSPPPARRRKAPGLPDRSPRRMRISVRRAVRDRRGLQAGPGARERRRPRRTSSSWRSRPSPT